jgi:hypothetical protein
MIRTEAEAEAEAVNDAPATQQASGNNVDLIGIVMTG